MQTLPQELANQPRPWQSVTQPTLTLYQYTDPCRYLPTRNCQTSHRRHIRRQPPHRPLPNLHPHPHALEIQPKAHQEDRHDNRAQRRNLHPCLRNTEKCLPPSCTSHLHQPTTLNPVQY